MEAKKERRNHRFAAIINYDKEDFIQLNFQHPRLRGTFIRLKDLATFFFSFSERNSNPDHIEVNRSKSTFLLQIAVAF